ncbi:ABC transporter permease [Burkholderia sp. IDO3]|uniref:ABC transporter permease n=1 Tax=Burkholderia sp. IDO3 TaxID=1705310 RepID=UPI000BBAECEF|nr:ABC transporter permease [Burkholderia sp. IDO3]AXK64596.1 ABC transporter [Burkholderia sp. IDO3]PCD60592.1 ABC transporter [Burkholderia sp. IDO3]
MEKLESTFKIRRSSLAIVKSVMFALFMREMQTRFGARRMGFLWVLMEPLAILAIILVFHTFVRTIQLSGVDVVMFMVSGIVPFHMMRNIAWRVSDGLTANQGLFSYRQVMPFDAFVARLIVEICMYSCAYIIICFFLAVWFDHDVLVNDPPAWIWALVVGIFLSFAFGVLFAIIGHAFPAAARPCKLVYIPLYVTSGVFFPISKIPPDKMPLVEWNPYVEIIESIRAAMFDGYSQSSILNYNYPLVLSLVLMFIVMVLYRSRRQILRVPPI